MPTIRLRFTSAPEATYQTALCPNSTTLSVKRTGSAAPRPRFLVLSSSILPWLNRKRHPATAKLLETPPLAGPRSFTVEPRKCSPRNSTRRAGLPSLAVNATARVSFRMRTWGTAPASAFTWSIGGSFWCQYLGGVKSSGISALPWKPASVAALK